EVLREVLGRELEPGPGAPPLVEVALVDLLQRHRASIPYTGGRPVSCPGTNTIQALVEGELPGVERERALAHAESCLDCRAVVVRLMRSADTPAAGALPPDAPATGGRIGRFVVLGRIGAGGMGVIVSAYDPDLDRKVAIKLIRPDLAGPEA